MKDCFKVVKTLDGDMRKGISSLMGADIDKYVYMYPKSFKDIFGCNMSDAYTEEEIPDGTFEGLLEISNGNRKIYRKFRAWKDINSDEMYLDYRSYAELGIPKSENGKKRLAIRSVHPLKFHVHNSDSGIKYAIILSLVSVIIGVLSLLLGICQFVFI